jgi:hypothetical protein
LNTNENSKPYFGRFYSDHGPYDHLNAFTQHGVNQGFIRKETEAKLIIKEDPKALLDLFLES